MEKFDPTRGCAAGGEIPPSPTATLAVQLSTPDAGVPAQPLATTPLIRRHLPFLVYMIRTLVTAGFLTRFKAD
ncbi:hypothetical protein GCM10011419_28090 [Vogesella fluminis]|uniref:Uncharacterized protein n=1 Tax=Vogesella fluminis TaxID=1069161 RepID=A0ABQ3HD77_9NEIS|nr:hypothetical protein GCM10011419_28090 [Vogesella fluminis]